jgi:hypothetical protein
MIHEYSEEEMRVQLFKHHIPVRMHDDLMGYIMHGTLAGDFLIDYLSGDLFSAVRSADDENIKLFEQYYRFLYNYAPSRCYGSSARVNAWCDRGGLRGSLPEKEGWCSWLDRRYRLAMIWHRIGRVKQNDD